MYGPLNLALANHDGADGSFSPELLAAGDSAQLQLTNPEHLRFLLHGDRMAAAWIGEHPGAFARLVGKKWMLYAGALRLGWTQWNVPGGLTGLRRPVDLFVPESRAALAVLVAGARAPESSCSARGRAPRDTGSLARLMLTVASLVRGGVLLRLRAPRAPAPAALDGRCRDGPRRRRPGARRAPAGGAARPVPWRPRSFAGGDARAATARPRSRRRRPRPPLRGDRHDPSRQPAASTATSRSTSGRCPAASPDLSPAFCCCDASRRNLVRSPG